MPAARSYTTTILADPDGSSMTAIEVPFDPREAFGRVRAPVRVTLNRFTYRSTICAMGGPYFVPLRRSNREAAGVRAGQRVRVTLTPDPSPRTVSIPADLRRALQANRLLGAFNALSYTHRREHAEAVREAKKTETRARRIAGCLELLRQRAAGRQANTAAPRGTRSAR